MKIYDSLPRATGILFVGFLGGLRNPIMQVSVGYNVSNVRVVFLVKFSQEVICDMWWKIYKYSWKLFWCCGCGFRVIRGRIWSCHFGGNMGDLNLLVTKRISKNPRCKEWGWLEKKMNKNWKFWWGNVEVQYFSIYKFWWTLRWRV